MWDTMLNHRGTVQLETERLILRRFTAEDAEAAYRNWTGDAEVCKYMRWQAHQNVEETRRVFSNWVTAYGNPSFYLWAIILKGSNKPIGSLSLTVVNELDACADVGYCIGREYWGLGYATEALKAVICFAFEEVGFNRIETYHSIQNPASGRVMQKAGMRFEGLARQKYKSNLGYEDSNQYAILRDDYISDAANTTT